MHAVRYGKPDLDGRPRVTVDICNTAAMNAFVTVTTVGELHLHSHHCEDATWFVIGGAAAFYNEEGSRFELQRGDFMSIEADTKYWFEAIGSEPAELLRVSSRDLREIAPVDPNRKRGNPNVKAPTIEPTAAAL